MGRALLKKVFSKIKTPTKLLFSWGFYFNELKLNKEPIEAFVKSYF